MSRLILLVTNDKHLEKHIKPLGDLYVVQSVTKGMQIAKAESFDVIVIGPPFSSEEHGFEHQCLYNIKTPEDLGKMLADFNPKTEEQNPEPTLVEPKQEMPKEVEQPEKTGQTPTSHNPLEPVEVYDYSILLVSTRRETISKLKQFNLTIATSSFSALQKKGPFDAVVWDMQGEHPQFPVPVYIWGKDAADSKELLRYLKPGQMYVETKIEPKKETVPVIREIERYSEPIAPVMPIPNYYENVGQDTAPRRRIKPKMPTVSIPKIPKRKKEEPRNVILSEPVYTGYQENQNKAPRLRKHSRLSRKRLNNLTDGYQANQSFCIKDLGAMLMIPVVVFILMGGTIYVIMRFITRS